jgi:CspA family cold shock protein
MSRYKAYREPRRRGYDDDNYSSPDRKRSSSNAYAERVPLAGPIAAPVEVTVTWFNQEKGFGFVKTAGGSDAFLHVRALEAAGHSTVSEGVRLQVRIEQGQKGQQVAEVLQIDASTATTSQPRARSRSLHEQHSQGGLETEGEGIVKWYNAEKGFGFIGFEGGDKDVFVHATALTRSGLTSLSEGQEVIVAYAAGKKGPEARSVRMKI